ncbi:carbohydrate porin [Leptothermofonsia sichuanensis E412]|uniref:iron uptake porin n=1 Tax=Leptothermofonsia sichuanensis TaxID=2917832 RepID=UPI001CA796D2|nr:iron uptake porin [Leptothermofonsia sichuanensis]QZZ18674.1 carbohydrate porin [Leptothermofonsia sichuanensis E412]
MSGVALAYRWLIHVPALGVALLGVALLGVELGFGTREAIATELPEVETEVLGLDQVTSVSQLTDVRPTDWAFQALQSLVERYGCIVGYPDRTFRGNRALSRYEFAAGVNACLDRVSELLTAATADLVRKEDLLQIQRLQEEFAAELAVLRGRIDTLQVRTATLEAQQFSVTTKLAGEAILARSDAFGGTDILGFGRVPASVDNAGQAVFQNRVRLNFQTSFTGKDLLLTRLEAGNAIPQLASGGTTGGANPAYLLFSNEGRLAYDNSNVAQANNSVRVSLLSYSFALCDWAAVTVFGTGGNHFNYADTVNPYLDDQDGGSGAVSRFGQHNPIYRIGGNGAGVGVNLRLSDAFRIDLGYLSNTASLPGIDSGLFNGNYSTLAQLVVKPFERFKLGLTYVHAYDDAGEFRYGGSGTATGTFLGNLLPGSQGFAPLFPPNTPIASNSYGVEVSFAISPRFVIGGWAGLTKARLIGFGDADIWNYAGILAFPDLFRRGSLGAIIVGAEPTLKGVRSGGSQRSVIDRDDALHIEAMYKFPILSNLSITPAIIWLPALNQNSANDDVFIGVMRTTYTF